MIQDKEISGVTLSPNTVKSICGLCIFYLPLSWVYTPSICYPHYMSGWHSCNSREGVLGATSETLQLVSTTYLAICQETL